MREYARFAKVSIDEVHVHWHADQRRNSCSLGEALGAKITLCTTPTDEDTFIHEVAHIGIAGQHSAKWAKLFVDMAKHFLPKYRAAAAIYDAWKSYKSIAVVCPNPMEEL
jgi:predicted metal-dependent hydrolase